jgi:hypothetical protein
VQDWQKSSCDFTGRQCFGGLDKKLGGELGTICWVTGVLGRGPLLPRLLTVSSSECLTVKLLQEVPTGNGVSGGGATSSIEAEVTLVL